MNSVKTVQGLLQLSVLVGVIIEKNILLALLWIFIH